MGKAYKCVGITNRVKGGYYVPFFDIDTSWRNEMKIYTQMMELQDKYELGKLLSFRTRNGYHFISLKLVKFNTLIQILEDAPIDPAFLEFTKRQKYSVLRISPKYDMENGMKIVSPAPKFYLTIKGVHDIKMPIGLYRFIQFYYDIPQSLMPVGEFVSGTEKIELIWYKTLKA